MTLKHEEKVLEYFEEIGFEEKLLDEETKNLILGHHTREKSKYRLTEKYDKKLLKLLKEADGADAKQRNQDKPEDEIAKEGQNQEKVKPGKVYSNGLQLFIETMNEDWNEEIFFPLLNYFQEILDTNYPNKLENLYSKGYDTLRKPYNNLFGKHSAHGNREIFAKINQNADFKTRYRNYLTALREVGFFVPASTKDGENRYSLFHHSKNVSALAECLYFYNNAKENSPRDQKKPFLFIACNFSGIQDFIKSYDKKAENQKYYAKRTRGRSFMLELLSTYFAFELCNRLKISEDCIISNSGGNFSIISPNTKFSYGEIQKVETDFNNFLFELSQNLNLAIAAVPASKEELKEIGNFWKNHIAPEQKKQKFSHFISKEDFYEKIFMPNVKGNPCKCGFYGSLTKLKIPKHPAKTKEGTKEYLADTNKNEKSNPPEEYDTEEVCLACRKTHKIGNKVQREEVCLAITSSKKVAKTLKGVRIHSKNNSFNMMAILTEPKILEELNEELKDEQIHLVFFSDVCLMKKSGETAYLKEKFSLLKETNWSFDYKTKPTSTESNIESFVKDMHVKRIAHAKLDVDNLGQKIQKLKYLSDYSAFTSQMDLFFGKIVSQIFSEKKQKGEKAYLVFAGGDDLYFISYYQNAVEILLEIREKLEKFFNGRITCSAGAFITHANYPVSRAIDLAEEEIGNAKNFTTAENETEKDKISFFGRTIHWGIEKKHKDQREEKSLNSMIKRSHELTQKEEISTAFLYKTYKLMKSEISIAKKKMALLYSIGRNTKKDSTEREIAENLKDALFEAQLSYKNMEIIANNYAFNLMQWALYEKRNLD